jgi:cell wall-associated NlpC family hydrolase
MCRVKGGGTDCTLFIGDAWHKVGILRELSYHYYPKEWYKHARDERILEGLYQHFQDHAVAGVKVARLEPGVELLRGDVLTFCIGSKGLSNHAAVWLGDRLIHASPAKGVVIVKYGHFFEPKTTNVFRIMRIS